MIEFGLRTYLGVVGAALTLAAAGAFWNRVRLWRTGARATGVVTGWTANYDTDGSADGWSPRVRFKALDGSEHELTGLAGWTRAGRRPVGGAVPVIYDPGAPSRALPGRRLHFWAAPPALLLLGGTALWAALTGS
jgi:hypothetical protein